MNVLDENRLPRLERRANLGIAIEVELEVLHERVLERRGDDAGSYRPAERE